MKKIFLVLAVLIAFFLSSGRLLKAQEASIEQKAATEAPKAQDAGNKICPVSGEKIDEKMKATYEYKGKIYNFCCPMCLDVFKKDPEKYINKIQEEKVTIDNNQEPSVSQQQQHSHC